MGGDGPFAVIVHVQHLIRGIAPSVCCVDSHAGWLCIIYSSVIKKFVCLCYANYKLYLSYVNILECIVCVIM